MLQHDVGPLLRFAVCAQCVLSVKTFNIYLIVEPTGVRSDRVRQDLRSRPAETFRQVRQQLVDARRNRRTDHNRRIVGVRRPASSWVWSTFYHHRRVPAFRHMSNDCPEGPGSRVSRVLELSTFFLRRCTRIGAAPPLQIGVSRYSTSPAANGRDQCVESSGAARLLGLP